MNCDQARKHWHLFHDSEGDVPLHQEVNEHLAACHDCSRWFDQQTTLEDLFTQRLRTSECTDSLWERIRERCETTRPELRCRDSLWKWSLLAAATLLLAVGTWAWSVRRHDSSTPGRIHLSALSASLHQDLATGHREVEFPSDSDADIEHYLRRTAGFRVHCPPRKDVDFEVAGAGVCKLHDRRAAYIFGKVGTQPVSLLVMERETLNTFPHDRDAILRGDGRHRCREGAFQMVAGITADNVVVVVGTLPSETLETLLSAYGSYHSTSG